MSGCLTNFFRCTSFPYAGAWYTHLNSDRTTYGADYSNIGTTNVTVFGNNPTASITVAPYSVVSSSFPKRPMPRRTSPPPQLRTTPSTLLGPALTSSGRFTPNLSLAPTPPGPKSLPSNTTPTAGLSPRLSPRPVRDFIDCSGSECRIADCAFRGQIRNQKRSAALVQRRRR